MIGFGEQLTDAVVATWFTVKTVCPLDGELFVSPLYAAAIVNEPAPVVEEKVAVAEPEANVSVVRPCHCR